MKHISIPPSLEAWRGVARDALHAGFHPGQLDLQDATIPLPLSLALEPDEPPTGPPIPHPHTSAAFLEAARLVAAHRDPQRWNLLYRILFRLQSRRDLLQQEADEDILLLTRLEAQVRRDLHAMQAFLRFRKVLDPTDPTLPEDRPTVLDEPIPFAPDPHAHHLVLETPTPFGPLKTELETCPPAEITPDKDCDHFLAWFQPEHRILPLAAPFFAERFASIRWTILTPGDGDQASVSWDPIAQRLIFGPGVPRDLAAPEPPQPDELELLWRTYYAGIFDPIFPPARPIQPRPEPLPARSTPKRSTPPAAAPSAQPFIPPGHTLPTLAAALPTCRGCDLYRFPLQAVGGRGPATAALMLVGEQPGDQEDLQGEPFVGPAGAVLDRILADLRIPREALYVTNAVKHFKFVQRGKLRLHQNPRGSEIAACRPWLLAEIDAVHPRVTLCLGASASKSLLGGTFSLMKDHGKLNSTPFAERVFATIHPSAILRARDDQNRRQLHQFLSEDLAKAWQAAQHP